MCFTDDIISVLCPALKAVMCPVKGSLKHSARIKLKAQIVLTHRV